MLTCSLCAYNIMPTFSHSGSHTNAPPGLSVLTLDCGILPGAATAHLTVYSIHTLLKSRPP